MTDPAACGENEMLKEADCPAARVSGTFSPVAVNPFPLTVMFEMLALEPPEFITTAFCACDAPTCTLPKLTLVGLIVNAAGETPVPVRAIFKLEFNALLMIWRPPLTVPADTGVNITLNVVDCPGLKLTGRVAEPALKPEPLAAI